jgi:hypothetical protein
MDYVQAFPSINEREFADACRSFVSRCEDNLSGTAILSVEWTGQELKIKQKRELMDDYSPQHPDDCEPSGDGTTEDVDSADVVSTRLTIS